ncbi:MAG: hypothetical protein WKH97_13070 [Casimicrobiaceae bacterium]
MSSRHLRFATSTHATAWTALLVAALAVGAWLRWYQLPTQIIVDDEWHAVHKLLASDAVGVLSHLGFADHSIPLTLYYYWLQTTSHLSEWRMHVPALAAGFALLITAPWLLRSVTSLPVRAVWVALLAVSPLLVYHSKTARPYAFTSLLTLVAIVAFFRWWQRTPRTPSWATGYFGATFASGYLHPVTLLFTLLPFAYFGAIALMHLTRPATRRVGIAALLRLCTLGALVAMALVIALLPPIINDWHLLQAKTGTDAVTLASLYRSALMLGGVRDGVLLATLTVFGALGIREFVRRDRSQLYYWVAIIVGGSAAVALMRPSWIQHPLVLARYVQPIVPLLLLFVAEGMIKALAAVKRPALEVAVVASMMAGLMALGPLPGYFYFPNQFMGHLRFQFDYDPVHNPYVTQIPREPVSDFYRQLGMLTPGSLTLIEAPWRLESHFNPLPWYQQIHRQKVLIGFVTPVCGTRSFGEYPEGPPGMRMRKLAHLSAVLRGETYGAAYLVVHLRPWKTPPSSEVEWPDVAACLPLIAQRYGDPVFRDGSLVVFDLRPANARAVAQ